MSAIFDEVWMSLVDCFLYSRTTTSVCK